MKLSVFGSIAYDELAQFAGHFKDILEGKDLSKLSVCFVVNDKKRFFGGVAGNICYGLQLLGTEVSICGALGQDAQDYLQRMNEWGVERSSVQILDGNTAMAFITSDEDENQIAHFAPGVIGENSPAPVIPETEWLLIGAENKSRMLQAFNSPAKIIFDPGQMIHTFDHEERTQCLKKAEILMVNEYEWQLLENEHSHATNLVIVTRGSEGVRLIENGVQKDFPCEPVKATDPTGAGDAFRAGFLHELMKDSPIEKCIQRGQEMGRVCVQNKGTQTYTLQA